MKSGCSGAHKPGRLGLSCKANKCIDAVTGDLGVLLPTKHHHVSPLVMPTQPVPSECRLKYKWRGCWSSLRIQPAKPQVALIWRFEVGEAQTTDMTDEYYGRLPASVVTAPPVNVFKKRLEKVWTEVFSHLPQCLNTHPPFPLPPPSHLHTTH